MLGTYALSAGYYDAYYGKAQKVRTLIRRDFEAAFARVDLLVGADHARRGVQARREDRPAGDVPERHLHDPGQPDRAAGHLRPLRVHAAGLPIGLQLIGRALDEATLLRAAHAYEQATPWRDRRPELT